MSALAPFFRRLVALALVACVVASSLAGAERIPPAPARFVTDTTHTLSGGAVARLNSRLEQYERESSNQILVAMFARMETDSSVEDYTVRVAEAWKVGQKGKNNGAVLFVFKQDRQIYIQVGYGLEPTLTDAVCHQIVENILKPRFRAGDFDGGVSAAVEAMIAATRGEFKGTGRTVHQARDHSPDGFGAMFVVTMLVVLVLIFRRFRREVVVVGGPRRYRSSNGPNIWFGGGSDGGWSSGGGGGWSSGGGGGFSGGGGSFGGGGAGGKW
ncbi:MAG: TPM domain-containing protein [Candidatus Didemnitutus sp.]|nr:TPM domain-containing protein [Candidatus Didemnitutus sp.]